MNRRTAIKQFFIIAGGLTILSSCLNDGGASIVLNKLKISAEDEQFLGDLANILIPKSDTPGGKDLNIFSSSKWWMTVSRQRVRLNLSLVSTS
jgi:hypothetical protein